MTARGRSIRIRIVIDRKAALIMLAVAILVGASGVLSSQQLTMTATYPIPAGIYNQIVTTGNSGAVAANTTLNRNSGDTILVPPANASGQVGIGTLVPGGKLDVEGSGGVVLNAGNVGIGTNSPASKLSVAGGIQLGNDPAACGPSIAGTQRWNGSALQICNGTAWTAPVATSAGMFSANGLGGCQAGTTVGCWVANPATGACSCPAGTSGTWLIGAPAAAPGYFVCTYFCH
jgi:hypothetical protein